MTWIVIPGWDKFQHPDAARSRTLPWIKDHTDQLSRDEYRDLSGHRRAVLQGLRLEYARSHCQLRVDTASLTRRLGLRVTMADLESLNHAGFIEFSASKVACLEVEKRREELKALPTLVLQNGDARHASWPCPDCGQRFVLETERDRHYESCEASCLG